MNDLRSTLYYLSICLFCILKSYLLILLFQSLLSKPFEVLFFVCFLLALPLTHCSIFQI